MVNTWRTNSKYWDN